jgi:hypothetical protein
VKLIMKRFLQVLFILFFLALIIYVIPSSPDFPSGLPNSYQSGEPADVETPLRRGYYTNMSRAEVIAYYQSVFGGYTLNYPPEEAQTIIRDQTKSTFLEEMVHPLRESIYINGFEPIGQQYAQYAIVIKGIPWRQKVIVRYVPSSIFVRIGVILLSALASFLLIKQCLKKE